MRRACLNILILIIIGFTQVIGTTQTAALCLINDQSKVEVPFDFINGLIVIKAIVNHKHSVNLILDTGAENLILFESKQAQAMGLELGKKVELKGSDLDSTMIAYISRKIPLSLVNHSPVYKDFIILEENKLNLSNSLGIRIDGLIGGRAFWGLILEFDFQKQLITFHKKTYFDEDLLAEHIESSIEIVDHKPYINTKLNIKSGVHIPAKLLIDSGSAIGFLLMINTHDQLTVPKRHINGPLGKGLGGEIFGYISKVKTLRLNKIHYFPRLLTHFQHYNMLITNEAVLNNRNGLIGNPVLSRFHFFIDYVDHKLFIKALKGYNNESIADKSGLILYASGPNLKEFVVKYVIDHSPAAAAGIKPGDRLIKVGLFKTRNFNLGRINHKLSGKIGKKIRLEFIRDGQKLKKSFRLKDFLSDFLSNIDT